MVRSHCTFHLKTKRKDENLNYNEFITQLKEKLQEYLRENMGEEVKVTYYQIMRNNNVLKDSFLLSGKSKRISPAIYLEACYTAYQNGRTVSKIAEDMGRLYQKCCSNAPVDIAKFTDFEYMKDKIFCSLINQSGNKALLKDIPHEQYLDLALAFYYFMQDDDLGNGMIQIRYDHLKLWHAKEEEICLLARENTRTRFPCHLFEMGEILRKPSETDQFPMYVLTNERRYYGACGILFDSVLTEAAQKLGGNFYVLPSSVHECILVPETDRADPEELSSMVREINQSHVLPEEVLSDGIYHYDAQKHHLTI